MAAGLCLPLILSAQTAKLQVIHNAADPAAASVDVYANGAPLLDNFAFRTATPFVDVPAGVPVIVSIAPGSSMSVGEAIFADTVTLESGKSYIAIANGVLNPSAFAANGDPAAKPIAFDIYALAGRTQAENAMMVDVMAFHGATDAPKVDIVAGGSPVIPGLSYGSASGYLSLPPAVYDLGVAPSGGNPIVTFRADLTQAAGASLTVVASGFLNPDANGGGPAFGLFAIPAAGGAFRTLEVVPTQQFAQVQVIHNAADPAAALVDVWAGNEPLINDFAFRTATGFVDVPAGVDIPLGIAPSTSDSANDAIATFTVNLAPGRYIVVANGVLDTTAFAANSDPEAASISFALYPIGSVRPGASSEGNVDILVFHGATDAPKVDVLAGSTRLIEGLSYGESSDYLSVPAGSYVLGVAPAGGQPIAAFTADVTGLAGKSIAVVASGFLDPSKNGANAPAFGLYAALPDGGPLAQLPATTVSVNEVVMNSTNVLVAPNPATTSVSVEYTLSADAAVMARIVDMTGRVVSTTDLGNFSAGSQRFMLNTADLPSGPYHLILSTARTTDVVPLSIIR
jgi:hypothetical protein